jgi:Mg2+/Co2+ transporter CorB
LDDIPLTLLFGMLVLLMLLSAFFSSSETSMMALNRYRLRHLANAKHRGALLATRLLKRPDRLIGLILLGNNLVNFIAASVATLIGIRLLGDLGVAIAPIVLVVVFLIFAEVMPKTVAALYPERLAFLFVYILTPLSHVLHPFVWMINKLANGMLSLTGIRPETESENIALSREELRTVVNEAGKIISRRHRKMLLSILDLETVTVEDIMVPSGDIVGVNLNAAPADIINLLSHCQHTRLPVYRDSIDNIVGILHVRYLLRVLKDPEGFTPEELIKITREPIFVPMGTPLYAQLVNFQRTRGRVGLVVDEYGMIQGLVTLEDILEEIVGEFTTDLQTFDQDIHPQEDGSFMINGTATLRDINKQLGWDLPMDGPKTLNGLILDRLEDIPDTGTSLRIGDFTLEITQVMDNAVKTAQVRRLSR